MLRKSATDSANTKFLFQFKKKQNSALYQEYSNYLEWNGEKAKKCLSIAHAIFSQLL